MTEELQQRLENSEPPFTKSVLVVDKTKNELVFNLFERSVREIEQTSSNVFFGHDWLEHDGFITATKSLSIAEVRSKFGDFVALEKASPGDFRVKLLFHSADFELVFRIYFLKEDDDSELEDGMASFDLVADDKILNAIASYLTTEGVGYVRDHAAVYFKGIAC